MNLQIGSNETQKPSDFPLDSVFSAFDEIRFIPIRILSGIRRIPETSFLPEYMTHFFLLTGCFSENMIRNMQPHNSPDAYTYWIAAASEFGATHGNWWNATVWSECRQMASQYFADIAQRYPNVSDAAAKLTAVYADIAAALSRLSDKEMETAEKIDLLNETKDKEAEATRMVADLGDLMRADAGG